MNCPLFTLPLVQLKSDLAPIANTENPTNKKVKPADFCETTEFNSNQLIQSQDVWVLYFYPRDNTSGCTQETKDFAELLPHFHEKHVQVYGISRDTIGSHQKFVHQLSLPFGLLADPEEIVCNLFNVMKQKKMYGKDVRGISRSTFVFRGGELLKEWREVKVPEHAQQVLDFIQTIED